MPSKQLDGGYRARRVDHLVNRGGDRHEDIADAMEDLGYRVPPSAVAIIETLLRNRRGHDTPKRNGWDILALIEEADQ